MRLLFEYVFGNGGGVGVLDFVVSESFGSARIVRDILVDKYFFVVFLDEDVLCNIDFIY